MTSLMRSPKGEHEDIISPEQLIPYTAAEIRKLLTLIHPPPPPEHGRAAHGLWWSRWPRHHQADANEHHRRRRTRELALNYN